MWVFIEIAFHNLVQARRRTALLGLGLLFVTFLLVSLLGLSHSIAEQLLTTSTTLSSGHVNIAGFNKMKPTDSAAFITRIAEIRKVVAENTPGLDYQVDRYRGWAQLSSETDSLQTGVAGLDVGEEPHFVAMLQLAPQSSYKEGGENKIRGDIRKLAEPNTILIFAAHAKQLNVDVGDSITMISQNPDGQTNTLDLRIVAIGEDISMMSNWTVFTNKQAMRDLYGLPKDTSGAVHVFLKDPAKSEEVLAHLRQVFAKQGWQIMEYNPQPFWMKFETVSGEDWIGEKLDLTFWKDEVSFVVWILTVVNGISVMLVALLLVIIGVGITNTMWIAVRERTGEIGTLRAIGMSKRRVLAMFLLEAALLGLFATALGAALAALTAWGIDLAHIQLPKGPLRAFLMSNTLHLSVSFATAALSSLAITLVTISAASWPAYRASRLQPITAIHQVN
jgi:putative ABC transport system permease protein